MQFVNITHHTVYTSTSGRLNPGQVSPDGGPKRRRLEDVLNEVIGVCGSNLGIRLNAREAQLINRLMELDEKGSGFDKSKLPEEIRNDPTGEKRNAKSIRDAQMRDIERRSDANAAAAHREAVINGEIREPVGPATLKGTKVETSMLKSGFERIMEENSRIAAGKKADVDEVLDPIGKHASRSDVQVVAPAEVEAVPGGDPVAVNMAKNLASDGTRSADAIEPVPQAPTRSGEMDRQAAEIAKGLATMGPVDGKGRKTRGKKNK